MQCREACHENLKTFSGQKAGASAFMHPVHRWPAFLWLLSLFSDLTKAALYFPQPPLTSSLYSTTQPHPFRFPHHLYPKPVIFSSSPTASSSFSRENLGSERKDLLIIPLPLSSLLQDTVSQSASSPNKLHTTPEPCCAAHGLQSLCSFPISGINAGSSSAQHCVQPQEHGAICPSHPHTPPRGSHQPIAQAAQMLPLRLSTTENSNIPFPSA